MTDAVEAQMREEIARLRQQVADLTRRENRWLLLVLVSLLAGFALYIVGMASYPDIKEAPFPWEDPYIVAGLSALAILGMVAVLSFMFTTQLAAKRRPLAQQLRDRGAEYERVERYNSLLARYGDIDTAERIMLREVWQGQTADMLRDSWGPPVDVDRQALKTKVKETWKYGRIGKAGQNRYRRRVRLDDGVVVGWEEQGG